MKGDYTPGKTVRVLFNTHEADGTPITLAGTPAVSVYKDGGTTESTAGVTLTVDRDSRTGMHLVAVDTSADGTFYSAGSDFDLVITTGTVDSISVVGTVVGSFSLANRSALRPATADRTLVVDGSGIVSANAVQISGDATAADNAESFFDGTGYAGTNNVIPTVTNVGTVTTLTNLPAIPAGWLTATGIAADAITAAKVAADVGTEIATAVMTAIGTGTWATAIPWNAAWDAEVQSECADALAAFGVSTYAGADTGGTTTLLARLTATRAGYLDNLSGGAVATAANLAAVAGYLDTEIAAILEDTGTTLPAQIAGLSFSTLDAAGVRAALGLASANLDTQIGTLATAAALATVDGVVDLILADTGTDGVVLSAATCNKIADHLKRRTQANTEASSDGDTLSARSLYGAVQQMQESNTTANAGKLTVFRTDGATELVQLTLASDADAEPITGVS